MNSAAPPPGPLPRPRPLATVKGLLKKAAGRVAKLGGVIKKLTASKLRRREKIHYRDFSSLPTELVEHIIDFALPHSFAELHQRQQAILSLSLVSRSFAHLVRQLSTQEVCIPFHQRISPFVDQVQSAPEGIPVVRLLSIVIGDRLREPNESVAARLKINLSRCTRLKDLRVATPPGGDATFNRALLRSLTLSAVGIAPNLTSLVLHNIAVIASDLDDLRRLSLPHLERLSLSRLGELSVTTTLITRMTLPKLHTLLIASHGHSSRSFPSQLLATISHLAPQLKRFELYDVSLHQIMFHNSHAVDKMWSRFTALEELGINDSESHLFELSAHVPTHLRHLLIRQRGPDVNRTWLQRALGVFQAAAGENEPAAALSALQEIFLPVRPALASAEEASRIKHSDPVGASRMLAEFQEELAIVDFCRARRVQTRRAPSEILRFVAFEGFEGSRYQLLPGLSKKELGRWRKVQATVRAARGG